MMTTLRQKHKFRVLLIEDEFNTVRGTARAIGLRVGVLDRAATIQEAIEHVKHKPYDLVIVDVRLPFTDGGELIPESGLDFISDLHKGEHGEHNQSTWFIVLTAQLRSLRLDLLDKNKLCKGVFGKLEHMEVMNRVDELIKIREQKINE